MRSTLDTIALARLRGNARFALLSDNKAHLRRASATAIAAFYAPPALFDLFVAYIRLSDTALSTAKVFPSPGA